MFHTTEHTIHYYTDIDLLPCQRDEAYKRLEEAKATVEYMDHKIKHYEDILAGLVPDDSNLEKWTEETRPELHSSSSNRKL